MLKVYEIIKEPIITEKTIALKDTFNKYTFKVDKSFRSIYD